MMPTIEPPIASSADASAPPTSRSNIKGTTKPIPPKIAAVDSKMAILFKNALTDGRALAVASQPSGGFFVPGCVGPLFRRIPVTILSRSKIHGEKTTWQ
jgi:hypothetical protein